MAITESQEAGLAERAKSRQDKTNPFLIHIEDGRLLPNTARTRKHPKYRVYTGDIRASQEERMAFIHSGIGGSINRPKVTNSAAEADEFDVGRATKDEMIVFAMQQFGVSLTADTDIRTMRKQIMQLYEQRSADLS
jgi:hypothetical protein